jgi:hypothetical protein
VRVWPAGCEVQAFPKNESGRPAPRLDRQVSLIPRRGCSHQPSEREKSAHRREGRREEKHLCSIHSTTKCWVGRRPATQTNHAAVLGAGQFYTDRSEKFCIS